MKPFPLFALFALFLSLRVRADFPKDWPEASPESEGFSTAKLDAAWATLKEHRTDIFVVIRNDHLIYERYANGFSRTKPHGTASLAKSLVGSMSLLVAMTDGRIDPDDLASKYVPQWAAVDRKKEITIRELASHTSGLGDAEEEDMPHDKLTGWKGDFWKRLPVPNDPFTIARDTVPVLFTPGTSEYYSNTGMAMLGYCLTASLKGAPQSDLRSLLKERVLDQIGVPKSEWNIGYGETTKVDDLPIIATWGGAAYSVNATARIGRLLLRKGDWEGKRIISAAAIATATAQSGLPNRIGLAWWVNCTPDGSRVWSFAPKDTFWGSGAGGQFLLVIPSMNLIAVRNGAAMDGNANSLESLGKYVTAPLMESVVK